MKNLTIEQKEKELKKINFFVGGLTDDGIEYHYEILINSKNKN
jgi:hypothetical protein